MPEITAFETIATTVAATLGVLWPLIRISNNTYENRIKHYKEKFEESKEKESLWMGKLVEQYERDNNKMAEIAVKAKANEEAANKKQKDAEQTAESLARQLPVAAQLGTAKGLQEGYDTLRNILFDFEDKMKGTFDFIHGADILDIVLRRNGILLDTIGAIVNAQPYTFQNTDEWEARPEEEKQNLPIARKRMGNLRDLVRPKKLSQ